MGRAYVVAKDIVAINTQLRNSCFIQTGLGYISVTTIISGLNK